MSPQNSLRESGRVVLKLGEDAIRESFLRLAPVTGLDLTKGVASSHARHHSHLNPEDVLPIQRSTPVDRRGLANYERGRGGKAPMTIASVVSSRLLIGMEHDTEVYLGEFRCSHPNARVGAYARRTYSLPPISTTKVAGNRKLR